MSIKKLDLDGNPYLGVLCSASESIAICPMTISKKDKLRFEETLGVELIKMSIQGATVLGSLCAMNNTGMMVPDFTLTSDPQRVFQCVMCLAFVQADLGTALHVGVEQPFDDEQGSLDTSDFP